MGMGDFRAGLIKELLLSKTTRICRNAYEMIVSKTWKSILLLLLHTRAARRRLRKIVRSPGFGIDGSIVARDAGWRNTQNQTKALSCKVVVLTVHDDPESVFEAFLRGRHWLHHKKIQITSSWLKLSTSVYRRCPMSSKIAYMIIRSFHKNPKSPLPIGKQMWSKVRRR